MCRIAVLPAGYKGDKIVSLLNYLEKEKGGDGNGFSWIDNEDKLQIVKGLKVKNNLINKISSKSELVLYHTRLTSAGYKDDDNCHPFLTTDGRGRKFSLCHNGTWSSHTEWKRILLMMGKLTVPQYKGWSDTHLMSWMISEQGADRIEIPESGVWVEYFGDHAVVYVKSGDFQAYKIGKKWIYASEFPSDDYKKVWNFQDGSVVKITADEGFKVLAGPKPKYEENTSYSSTTYVNSTSSFVSGKLVRNTYYHRGYPEYGIDGDGVKSIADVNKEIEDRIKGEDETAAADSDSSLEMEKETKKAKVYIYNPVTGLKEVLIPELEDEII